MSNSTQCENHGNGGQASRKCAPWVVVPDETRCSCTVSKSSRGLLTLLGPGDLRIVGPRMSRGKVLNRMDKKKTERRTDGASTEVNTTATQKCTEADQKYAGVAD